ncbi:unnamed protein product [Protopolystoma xenopodis]|uniref:Uncharacterized protein n=1 Tax=Protopolystoma xenopodis TaxID=117903 RepID=A0A3S5FD37_9PLAT|nr:unnamed protein product [Protopolystoma xenopodis]
MFGKDSFFPDGRVRPLTVEASDNAWSLHSTRSYRRRFFASLHQRMRRQTISDPELICLSTAGTGLLGFDCSVSHLLVLFFYPLYIIKY